MSTPDDITARQRKLRLQYSFISSQFRNLMAKADALEALPNNKQKLSQKNNTEAGKSSTQDQSERETVESVREACKELANTIRDVLKELDDDKEEESAAVAAGPSSGPPPAAAGNN